jgi:hypothetical protein
LLTHHGNRLYGYEVALSSLGQSVKVEE